MSSRRKRPTDPTTLNDFLGAPKDDMKKGVDSLLRSDAETARAEPPHGLPGLETGIACPLAITGLHAVGQTGPQSVFRLNEDALVLRIEVRAMAAWEGSFDANFQLLDYTTNTVEQDSWCRGLTLQHQTDLSISQGNSQGPGNADRTPPAAWGLHRGVYVFRALIEIPALSVFLRSDGAVLFRVR